jgi:hypothetical protein
MRLVTFPALRFITQLRASAALGRATRLRGNRKPREALAEALRGLRLLHQPYIRRTEDGGAIISTLTIFVESLASEIAAPGASPEDLRDSIAFLKSLQGDGHASLVEPVAWLPRLEAKYLQVSPAA